MEENKNLDEYGTHWVVNILCVCRKNWQEMVHNKLFANSSRTPYYLHDHCVRKQNVRKCIHSFTFALSNSVVSSKW